MLDVNTGKLLQTENDKSDLRQKVLSCLRTTFRKQPSDRKKYPVTHPRVGLIP
jgi:hypothetical protein